MKQIYIIAIAIVLFFSATMEIEALTVTPHAITGLRSFDGGVTVYLLTMPFVKGGDMEDRTVGYYALNELPGEFLSATLNIPITYDPFDPGILGIFEVHTFYGCNGAVGINDWSNIYQLVQSFTDIPPGTQTLSIDITQILKTAKDSGQLYLCFTFQAGNFSRYNLGPAASLAYPTITVETKGNWKK